ncbi:MAG: DinB family protein [Thermaceae bacterium]|nr:DinB family protein [Thermaceae bacterium]
MADSRVELLLTLIDQAYDVRTWHGSNLRNALRGVDAETALWRPQPERHNIWELALHCAYWKYIISKALRGEESKSNFPRKPANFAAIPEKPTPKAWKEDLGLLEQYHLELRQAVAALKAKDLEQKSGRWTLAEHAFGAANHDIYHAGQIRLLRRMKEGV